MRFSVKKGWIEKNVIECLEYRRVGYDKPVYLDEIELAKIENKDFGGLNDAKDIFLFCAYTGLLHCDYLALRNDNFEIGVDGRLWLYYDRIKGSGRYGVAKLPLIAKAVDLLKKYKMDVKKMPRMTKENLSRCLKIMAKSESIDKNVSSKIARKTFAYMALNVWHIPEVSVAGMMGHSSTAMLRVYTDVSARKIANDTKDLI